MQYQNLPELQTTTFEYRDVQENYRYIPTYIFAIDTTSTPEELEKYLREVVFLNKNEENVTSIKKNLRFYDEDHEIFNTFGMSLGEKPYERISSRKTHLVDISLDDNDNYIVNWGAIEYQRCFWNFDLPQSPFPIDPSQIDIYPRTWVRLQPAELNALNNGIALIVNSDVNRMVRDIKNNRFSPKPNQGSSTFMRFVNHSPYPDEKYYEWWSDDFTIDRADPNPSWFVVHRIPHPEISHKELFGI